MNGSELTGDYLVIALGAEYAPETIPGLAQAGHNFYTLAGAESLREARMNFRTGRLVVLVSGVPFKCPAAPYEAAMLLESDLRRRGARDRTSVGLYSPEPGPMGVAAMAISAPMSMSTMTEAVHGEDRRDGRARLGGRGLGNGRGDRSEEQ